MEYDSDQATTAEKTRSMEESSTLPDIFHDFEIRASAEKVFQAVSTPAGLDSWWTSRSSGEPRPGAEYELWFAPVYDWRAVVTKFVPDVEFELQLTRCDKDWHDTRVGFVLRETGGVTHVQFHHTGWQEANGHYRTSSFCWALYLRLLKRYLERGEVVPYEERGG